MVERIIDFSARNKFIVLLLTAVAVAMAVYAMRNVPLDAIPDLSDTQVIIYSRWDRSPDIMEDQVTYPIITALLGAPKVKAIRGFSDFGYSFVYIVFEDGTDPYWARSRTLEYLSKIQSRLPEGVSCFFVPRSLPDGTRNTFLIQRLKDKVGNRSNASSEIEFRNTRAHLVGPEGRGIATLIDPYGSEDEVEFFAVASETFIELSRDMQLRHPRLYGLLARLYGIDPAAW